MIEGALFMLDVLLVTMLCIGIKRAEQPPADSKRLGVFAYDEESE